MKKVGIISLLSNLFLLLVCTSTVQAEDQYEITANVIDIAQVCYVTGMVTDASGKGVYPAEVKLNCGSVQIKVSTLPNGAYIANPPPCVDFTITATATGQGSTSQSDVRVNEDELVALDLSFSAQASLENAIRGLQVVSGLTTDQVPPDQNQDDRIGLEDAIYTLQVIAELRGGTSSLSGKSAHKALSASHNVTLGQDTDGDGVDDWFQNTATDAYGYLEIGGLSGGTYSLTVRSSANSSAVRVENIVIEGAGVHLKTLRMKPVGSIRGIVQLQGTSDHGDIHVRIPGTSYDAYTDSAGNFTLANVPEGTYAIKASKATYGTLFVRDVPVESGMESVVDAFMLPSAVGQVSGTVWLQGAVDYTGILVTLRKDLGTTYLTTTNATGEYAFQDVPIGNYELVASMAGYLTSKSSITVSSGSNPQTPLLVSINTVKGTLAGTVTLNNFDDHSGILVSLAGTQYLGVTDASGAYTIGDIPEGTYTVFMKAEGYGAERFLNVQITTGETTILNGSLTTATGTAYGSIVGTAFYLGKSGHSGISVKVEGTAIPLAGTDTKGGFIISNVPSGTYTLLFTQANYKTVTKTGIVVPPWETVFIRQVQMIPPVGHITGRVQLEGESSHDNVTVSVDGTSISAQSLADGSFLLENVDEGTASITAYKAGFETAHVASINVLPGQTVILEDTISLSKPPEPPTGVTATQASGSSVNVAWTASVSPDVAGYNVYYGIRSDKIDQKANTTLVSAAQFEVTGLSKATTYYFAVEAVDNDGLTSVFSQYDSAEIVPGAPIPPAPSEIYAGQYPFVFPEAISLSRDGQLAYVTNPFNDVVSLVDVATAIVIGTIVVGDYPVDLTMNPVRDEVYCVNKDNDTITVIDSTQSDPSQAVTGTLNTADAPVRAVVSPDGKYLFVSSVGAGADNITVIDLDTGSEITGSPISVGIDPQGMAIANNKVYVANEGDNTISVIDIDPASATRWQKLAYNIPVGESPSDVTVNQDGSFVYVANQGSDTVSVINTTTDQVVKTLNVGDYPYRMAASGNILYVTNRFDDNVSMINMDTNEVLVTGFAVGNMPKGIAVTADGETIYVVNNGSESVSIRVY